MGVRALAFRRLASIIGLAIALSFGTAQAADLDIAYQSAPMVPRPFSWAGYYFGVYAGGAYGQSSHDVFLPTGNFNMSGALIGGTIGFNFEMANWVAGVEFDAGWSNLKGETTTNCFRSICRTESSGLVTFRGRAGPSFGRFLPYLTAGVAFAEVNPTVTAIGTASTYMTGYAAGAGAEFALNYHWLVKLEYLHVDVGTYGCGPCGFLASDHVTFKMEVMRLGLNYKFDM